MESQGFPVYKNHTPLKTTLMRILLIAFAAFFCHSCQPVVHADDHDLETTPGAAIVDTKGQTIETRFNAPPGYIRTVEAAGTWGAFLRNSKLKPDGAMVYFYNGEVKQNPGIYAAVLTWDVGSKDLQQCADAVMRQRAEYWFSRNMPGNIHFNLTNGFKAGFSSWADGYRLRVKGNHTDWVKTAAPASGHASLRQYLDVVYAYASTLSLSKELVSVPYTEMKTGDVLIIGGTPGHAVTVMDMAVSKTGKKVFLLSQSYMPAQEIHILHNPQNREISPWYELDEKASVVLTPQWQFTTAQLKRFPAE